MQNIINNLSLLSLSMVMVMFAVVGCDRNEGPIMPPKGFVADRVQGKALYDQHCAQCHGRDLRGTRQGPILIHKTYHPNHHADLAFYLAARQGVKQHHWDFGDMPKQPQITPESMGHIIAYVRNEQKRAGIF